VNKVRAKGDAVGEGKGLRAKGRGQEGVGAGHLFPTLMAQAVAARALSSECRELR
jgi:hypothetical protein